MIIILRFLILVTNAMLLMMCLLGLYFAIAKYSKDKKSFIALMTSILTGLIGGFTLFYIKLLYPKALNLKLIRINRYNVIAIAITLLISLMLSLIFTYKSSKNKDKSAEKASLIQSIVNSLSLCALLIYSSAEIFRLTQSFVYFGETSVGTNTLFRVIGFTIGLSLMFLISLSFYSVGKRLNLFLLNLLTSTVLLFSSIIYGSRAIMALQRLKIIKPTKIVFKIMIFADNYSIIFLYLILLVGAISGLYINLSSRKIKGTFKNNALRRIEKKKMLLNKRWGISIILFTFMSFTTLTYLSTQLNKEVELSPPKEYLQDDSHIYIPLDIVNDGHLHRFSFILEDKRDVRFIVVRKGEGSSYGVGLDACDICGEAGYYERKDEVICKKCDVVMNKATIGLKGGCNPVPFPYVIKDSQIIIEKKDLIKEGYRFKLKSK